MFSAVWNYSIEIAIIRIVLVVKMIP